MHDLSPADVKALGQITDDAIAILRGQSSRAADAADERWQQWLDLPAYARVGLAHFGEQLGAERAVLRRDADRLERNAALFLPLELCLIPVTQHGPDEVPILARVAAVRGTHLAIVGLAIAEA